ncbi:MAG: SGNH/GDSL hydrolase family protein [Candidatus Hydrogenedentes bacterium]|nr:SGNH/GDSL hydrolase family protein [Candidatus Hydrogenedentota bacterium]
MRLQSGDKILFIGDSITDAGRREDPDGLGQGYVRMFRDVLAARHPSLVVDVVNQGIGGDTIRDLDRRWQSDVLAHRPTWLSISIGVNDVWRQLQTPRNPDEVMIDEFEATYRRLLTPVVKELHCKLLLLEPGINGETLDTPHNKLTGPYVQCVNALAAEFKATLVPINRAFWNAIHANPSRKWTADGVHPSSNGHMLMALAVYDALDAN